LPLTASVPSVRNVKSTFPAASATVITTAAPAGTSADSTKWKSWLSRTVSVSTSAAPPASVPSTKVVCAAGDEADVDVGAGRPGLDDAERFPLLNTSQQRRQCLLAGKP
jgi:hypothetical protein